MNTDAFEAISNIEDKNGRSILAEDPRKPDSFTLFGRPVEVYDTIVTTDNNETDIMFGDFKRGYRMFDRKAFEFRMTDTGAGAFETDTVKARGISRFDGQRMDKKAIVIVRDVNVENAPESPQGLSAGFAPLALGDAEGLIADAAQTAEALLAEAGTEAQAKLADADVAAGAKLANAEKAASDIIAKAEKEAKVLLAKAQK